MSCAIENGVCEMVGNVIYQVSLLFAEVLVASTSRVKQQSCESTRFEGGQMVTLLEQTPVDTR